MLNELRMILEARNVATTTQIVGHYQELRAGIISVQVDSGSFWVFANGLAVGQWSADQVNLLADFIVNQHQELPAFLA